MRLSRELPFIVPTGANPAKSGSCRNTRRKIVAAWQGLTAAVRRKDPTKQLIYT